MDFSYSEEQQLIKDSVDRFVREEYELDQRRKIMTSKDGYSAENWSKMAELGWLGVSLPEEYGGYGGGPVEIMIIMEAFGAGLVVEPFFATVVLGANAILKGGTDKLKQEILPAVAEGKVKLAFAYAEPQARFNLADIEVAATKDGDDYVINGHKAVVLNAASADYLVVTSRTSGDSRDEKGITVFLVDAKADGISRRDYPTVDGLRASEIEFANVKVAAGNILGSADGGLALIEDVVDHGIAALCAEAVGCMQVLQDTTNEYLKTRKQFGVAIGKFQVLQHRMVDMFMETEQSRSMSFLATLKLSEEPVERTKAASAAKVQIGKGGRFVGQQSVQLHGGMGMTDELNVGHYFKRLTMIDTMFGNQDHHLRRYAQHS